MKNMHTTASEAPANRSKRRFYSTELKTQVMQECCQPGASIASVALSHGINANIVHRWLREGAQSALVVQSQAFVPVTLDKSAPVPTPTPQAEPYIWVEVHRANTAILVKWPLRGGAACAAWLRAYSKDVLTRLPTHKNNQIENLLPHRWHPAHQIS